jgi:hypothetical protein
MARRSLWKRRGVSPGQPGAQDISQQIQALTSELKAARVAGASPLSRPEEWREAGFPPGWPLAPQLLDTPRPDGLADPRLFQYPVTINLPGVTDRVVPWATLKKAAESPVFRNCIEIRKTAISTLDWTVQPSARYIERQSKITGQAKNTIERGIRDKYGDDIERGLDFWANPDRKNGRDFSQWIGLLVEEALTWDAMAIYPHKTYGGDLLGLWIIDGSTIKPLLDETGGRPEPPSPAYQQLLYGFPRGEFTADTIDMDGKIVTPGALDSTQLIYERWVMRTYSPYGFGPTEQALLDGLLWNKRFAWMISEYTEGAQPATWLINKGQTDWTPGQLLEYEKALNDHLSGQTAERMRNRMLPVGIEPSNDRAIPERYRPEYDLFILKLVLAHFDVDISEYGFTEPGGLGSSGYHEGKADLQYRKATLPTSRRLENLLTRIQANQLKLAPELEFHFLGLEDEDEAAADALADARVRSGRMTLNEDRANRGQPAYKFREADMAVLETQRGVVYLEGSSELVPAGVLIEPASEHPDVQGDDVTMGNTPAPRPKMTASVDKAVGEILTYQSWARKIRPGSETRPFEFEHMTADLAREMGFKPGLPVQFAKAGGAGPKATGQDGSKTSSWSPYSRPGS